MAVYTSSVVRAAAPSWLKIKYSYYFCASVSMSVLPYLPSCITSFLCFIPFASSASFPYLSLVLRNTRKGFVSAPPAAAVTPVRLQYVTLAKGTFPSTKPTCERPPYCSRREWSSGLVSATDSQKNQQRAIYWESSHNTHQCPFPRQIWVYGKTLPELLFQLSKAEQGC